VIPAAHNRDGSYYYDDEGSIIEIMQKVYNEDSKEVTIDYTT
jgi:hypothetical protein